MSIAPINCIVLQLTEEKGILEVQRTFIDARRELVAQKITDVSTEYTSKIAQLIDAEEGELPFDEEELQADYDATMAKLNAQDKALEMQRTNLGTRIDGITTQLEGAEKRLNKNVENEFKGVAS